MNQTIYDFLCSYLTEMNIPFHASVDSTFLMPDIDMGLRNSILKEYQRETISSLQEFNPQALYHFSDYYNCTTPFSECRTGSFSTSVPICLKTCQNQTSDS